MRFDEMPEIVTCFMFLWILVIFILGICNILRAVQMKRTRHIRIRLFLSQNVCFTKSRWIFQVV